MPEGWEKRRAMLAAVEPTHCVIHWHCRSRTCQFTTCGCGMGGKGISSQTGAAVLSILQVLPTQRHDPQCLLRHAPQQKALVRRTLLSAHLHCLAVGRYYIQPAGASVVQRQSDGLQQSAPCEVHVGRQGLDTRVLGIVNAEPGQS